MQPGLAHQCFLCPGYGPLYREVENEHRIWLTSCIKVSNKASCGLSGRQTFLRLPWVLSNRILGSKRGWSQRSSCRTGRQSTTCIHISQIYIYIYLEVPSTTFFLVVLVFWFFQSFCFFLSYLRFFCCGGLAGFCGCFGGFLRAFCCARNVAENCGGLRQKTLRKPKQPEKSSRSKFQVYIYIH